MADTGEVEDAEMKEWDPQATDNWKHDAEEKNTATRLQDLSLGLNSSHEVAAAANQNQSWPFEKSPCRWHGGKNTRGGAEAEAINKQLFKTDFVKTNSNAMDVEVDVQLKKNKVEDDTIEESEIESDESTFAEEVEDDDDSTSGSFCDDDDVEEDLAPTKASSRNKSERKITPNSAADISSDRSTGARRSASKQEQRVSCEDMETEPEQPTTQRKSSSSASSKRSELKEAQYAESRRRDNHYNNMLAWNKPASHEPLESLGHTSSSHHRRRSSTTGVERLPSSSASTKIKDELSASCHGQVERERKSNLKSSSSSMKSGREDLPSATFHGPVSQSRMGPSSTATSSSSRRVPPPRTKSSDGAELGAATLHGGTSVSRIRGGKRRPPGESSSRSGSSKDSKGAAKPGERRMLKRAMSIRNVKRPEEYAAAHGVAPAATEPNDSMAKSSSRRSSSHSLDRSSSVRNLRQQDPSITTRSSSRVRAEESAIVEPKPRESSSSRTSPHRNRAVAPSPHRNRTNSLQPQQPAPPQRSTSGSSHTRQRRPTVSAAPTEPRRDLLVLLRDQKKVTQNDLLDKENRRLLHFLMMEHKMGVSCKELYHAIRAEQAEMAA